MPDMVAEKLFSKLCFSLGWIKLQDGKSHLNGKEGVYEIVYILRTPLNSRSPVRTLM